MGLEQAAGVVIINSLSFIVKQKNLVPSHYYF